MRSWWSYPWRKRRVLAAITLGYLAWSLLPVLIAVLFSFNAGRSRTVWQGFSMRWYTGDATRSVWHDASLHAALLQTLKLGLITTLVTVPLGVAFAIGMDRWRGPLPQSANVVMLLSFVIPETLLAVALLFLVSTIALPFALGTTAQVVGLVTFQISYPAVIVRARLATIGRQYEEAARDLGATALGALRRVLLPMLAPAVLASTVLVFAWEQANIFAGWTCVGHAADLPDVGSQRPVRTGAGGVLLVRGEDDRIRAFANTCRHRGHELLQCGPTAQRHRLVCPYHSWSYKLDGSLRNGPGLRGVDGFEQDRHGLTELRLVSWHGWLFVDPGGQAGDFAEQVAGFADVIGPYNPAELTVVTRHSYELAANWKVIVENYQECYHCSTIHPELSRISPPTSGENLVVQGAWIGGWMDLIPEAETMSLDGRSGGVALSGLSQHELRTVMYIVGYPNLLVSLHPDYVMTHLMTPLAADRTLVECAWAFSPEASAKPGFDPSYAVDFWDLTNRQDWAACESVQRGLSSPHAIAGPLAPDEDGVYQFVTRVARAYLGEPPRETGGSMAAGAARQETRQARWEGAQS